MENNDLVLDRLDKKLKSRNKLKHFFVFALIVFVLIIMKNVIAFNASSGDNLMIAINIETFIEIPLLITLMIRTYKGKVLLSFWEKFFFVIGLLIVLNLFTFLINWINPFGRNISEEEFQNGMRRTTQFSAIMIIICLPIISLIKSKRLPTKDSGHYNGLY